MILDTKSLFLRKKGLWDLNNKKDQEKREEKEEKQVTDKDQLGTTMTYHQEEEVLKVEDQWEEEDLEEVEEPEEPEAWLEMTSDWENLPEVEDLMLPSEVL